MKGPTRMAGEPGADLGMLVGGVVVGDGVDDLAGWDGAFDGIEEADELLMTMTLHALAEDFALKNIERRE